MASSEGVVTSAEDENVLPLRGRRSPLEVSRSARDWLLGLGPIGGTVLSAALVLVIAVADAYTPPGVQFTLLYLQPIGMGTLLCGFGVGTALAALATACGLAKSLVVVGAGGGLVLAWNALQELGVFVALVVVLDAFHRRLLHAKQAARTDPLTGLANRRAFVEAAWMELERARRHGRPLSVLYLDCDDFKSVNDRMGHSIGDEVLRVVGSTLREGVRGHDTVARLGGDEFGVLLPEFDGTGATALTERLRARLGEALRQRQFPVTLSVGVATFAVPPASVDEMILRADELMYEAKRSGKDGWRAGVWGEVGLTA